MSDVEITKTTVGLTEAYKLVPLVNGAKLRELMKAGKGPKFARVNNKIVFRVADLTSWYDTYQNNLFSTKDTRVVRVATTHVGKIGAAVKAAVAAKPAAKATAPVV